MIYRVTLGDKLFEVEVEKGEAIVLNETTAAPAPAPATAAPTAAPAAAPAAPAPAGSGEPISAPMPGTVFKVACKQGQSVKKGDVLIILEAMKMENEIMAPRDGTVSSVAVSEGAAVETGTVLAYLN